MIDSSHAGVSIARQCELVSISRSVYYYQLAGESELNLMRLIDEQCKWGKRPDDEGSSEQRAASSEQRAGSSEQRAGDSG